tara:strand:- start:353 stop:1042 length:690 start_codon:yes stop_codon:yes gene_type:complete
MKQLITLIILSTYSLCLTAQSLVVTGVTTANASDPCFQASTAPITVKNVSSNTLDVLCEKIIIDTAAGTSNNFCWGANCYGASTYISTDFNTLDPGEGDGTDFSGYYDAFCNPASATVQYCFFPASDINDRSCITIEYNGNSTSIKEADPYLISEFYPNPAKEIAYFDYYLKEPAQLVVMDILGTQVKRVDLSSKVTQEVKISDLSQGIYFGNVIVNNEILAIKRLIVK